ncbi:MAG: flagellar biosynthesis protein FlhB [Phycisphaerae bacterium]
MAADAGEKTEAATPRRRTEARSRGQVAKSQDLTAAALLLAAFVSLEVFGPRLFRALVGIMRTALAPTVGRHEDEIIPFAAAVAIKAFAAVAPFLLVLVAVVVVVMVMQVGFLLTWQPLIPNLSRLNPLNGIKRLFSLRAIVVAVINMGKLLVVGAVGYWTLSGSAAEMIHAVALGFPDVLRLGAALSFKLSMRLSVAFLILALADLAYQRFQRERDMRMTKEEVKDELRSMEGDPHTKRRRRQVQLQLAMQRLGRDVPQADVVVTNPTHLAIALRYDVETMPAPKVLAKGADHVALRIRQLALEHGIPIVERRPLVRAMYDAVDVGDFIPERFYQAIAEVLAYVYELSGAHVGGLTPEPAGVRV